MKFRPGQLVQLNATMMMVGDDLKLYNVPGGVSRVNDEIVRAIGHLRARDVALIVAQERTTAGEVYVVGPNGGGWAPTAYLKILQGPVRDANTPPR